MAQFSCPTCGETEALRGEKRDETIWITCGRCSTEWVRDPDVCPACGERSVADRRVPLYQKARGTQQSIIGYRITKECWACGWQSE